MTHNKTRTCLKANVFRNVSYITPTAKVLKLIKEEMKVTYVLNIMSEISFLYAYRHIIDTDMRAQRPRTHTLTHTDTHAPNIHGRTHARTHKNTHIKTNTKCTRVHIIFTLTYGWVSYKIIARRPHIPAQRFLIKMTHLLCVNVSIRDENTISTWRDFGSSSKMSNGKGSCSTVQFFWRLSGGLGWILSGGFSGATTTRSSHMRIRWSNVRWAVT